MPPESAPVAQLRPPLARGASSRDLMMVPGLLDLWGTAHAGCPTKTELRNVSSYLSV
jgi:hypothetical protein